MKKVFIALSLVASFSAMANNGIGGFCGNGATVGQTVDFEGNTYKVQWITKSGPDCKPGVDQFKLVPEHEYISPNVFKDYIENSSLGKAIFLGFLNAELAGLEFQKTKTRDCLQANNNQARSCLPKTEVEIAQAECNNMGFQIGTQAQQQCVMATVMNNKNIKAQRQATNDMIRSAEHTSFMNNLRQQNQPQPQVDQGYRNYDCRARLGGRVECTGF
jgi:hypothetical protein